VDSVRCPVCGSDAIATVVSTAADGAGSLRSYCRACQDRAAEEQRNERRSVALLFAGLLVYAGVVLLVLTAAADHLHISGHAGFGWRQMTGFEVGCIAILLGLLARRGLVGMAGLFLLVLSIGADLLQVGHAPGFGWRARVAMLIATLMLVVGVVWRRALERRLHAVQGNG
jgi:peptidoglycan/LPS O-acetylase OafA/YrhL